MSLLDALFDRERSKDELVDYLDREFLVADMKSFCIYLNINKSYTRKYDLAKRLASFIHDVLRPRLERISKDLEYRRQVQLVTSYIQQRMKAPNDTTIPVPEILTNLPDEFISGARHTKKQKAVIVIPELPPQEEELVKEIDNQPLEEVSNTIVVSEELPPETMQEPSIQEMVEDDIIDEEPTLFDTSFTNSLEATYRQFAILFWIDFLNQPPSGKQTISKLFKTYLKSQGIILPDKELMKRVLAEIDTEIQGKPKDQQLTHLYTLLTPLSPATSRSASPERKASSPRRSASPQFRAEIVEAIQAINEPVVEEPTACYIQNKHESLEELANDLSCPSGQVCNVVEKQCVNTEEASEITTLQIGDRVVSVAGKDKEEILNDIKMEILTLTYRAQEQKRQEETQERPQKKYKSEVIHLDQLWNKLKSVQSSQLLYTQRKVAIANQQLRDQIQKCLFR
jgi:hypothetical protein